MKFMHIADIHLGADPEVDGKGKINRGNEIWETFTSVIREAGNFETDLLLIAGDLFHRQPLLRELKEVNYLFSTIPNTKVILIAGNHDYMRPGSYYHTFEWNPNVYFLKNNEPEWLYLEELNTEICGFSYHSQEIREAKYDNLRPMESQRINILLAHGGDEKHVPINKRRLAVSGFDYIALGHIHKPELYSDYRMAYAGSLEPTDCNDIGARGYMKGEVDKNTFQIQFVPFSRRRYLELLIPVTKESTNSSILQHISREMEKSGKENIYKLKLEGFRDPDILIDTSIIKDIGTVTEVMDATVPDYDFPKILHENESNLLGMYIDEFLKSDPLDEIAKKALYYGTKALFDAMGD